MGVATYERSDLDLFSDAVLRDPHPHFTELRERAAVVYMEALDVWAVTRYEPIRSTLADWEAFSSRRVAFNDAMNQALTGTSLATDPPDHQQLRAALTKNLSPRALRGLKDRITRRPTRWSPNSWNAAASTRWTTSPARFRWRSWST